MSLAETAIVNVRFFRNPVLVVLFCMLFGAMARAQIAASEADAEVDPEQVAHMQALAAELEVREAALSDLQSESGIYAPELMEAYSDLGALYTELGDYDNAARVYNDALQVARINTGLYSEQQLPLLDSLIDAQQKRRDWAKVDDLAHLSLHLHRRLYNESDPRFLEAAMDFGGWRLRVLNENLLDQGNRALLNTARDVSQFYGALISSLDNSSVEADTQLSVESGRMLTLLDGKAQADMTLARAVANTPYTFFQGTSARYINQTRCQNVTNAQGEVVRQCYQVRVENPRYRQSQREAKRYELSRHTREISDTLARMQTIRDTGTDLSDSEREQLDMRIAELRTQAQHLRSSSSSLLGF